MRWSLVEIKAREIEKVIPKEELTKSERDRLIFEGDKDDKASN